MRRILSVLSVLALTALVSVLAPGDAFAVAHTVNFTAAQDTQTQTKLVPLYNREHCRQYSQAPGCSSANLVSGGCVVRTVKTLTIESCTIFTADGAGEDLLLQEILNQKAVEVNARLVSNDAVKRETAFQGLSAGAQTTACTDLGLTTPDCP